MSKVSESTVIECGKRLFSYSSDVKPSVFNKSQWVGKIMDWSMHNEAFKTQLFRFVDVFPMLKTNRQLSSHIAEYFTNNQDDMPPLMKWGGRGAALGGMVGGGIMRPIISGNIKAMASQFIIGENTATAVKRISKLRQEGFATVIDVLGEATVNEEEAETYISNYLELLEDLKEEQKSWPDIGNINPDSPSAPKINISVKPTALYSQIKPQDAEGVINQLVKQLARIYEKVIEVGGFLCIDMEALYVKDITIEVYKRLRSLERFRHYPHLGLVLQAYLRETDRDVDELLEWARKTELPISIRLVKGAYWDYETVSAKQHNWPLRVYTIKAESDCAFERIAARILHNSDICHFACGSHNMRTIAAVLETARALNVPEDRYEFQVLYGMAEPVRKAILKETGRVRLYCPYGDMVPGMAYLVRRLLENTANESFLRQSFADKAEIERLLESPAKTAERERAKRKEQRKQQTKPDKKFKNHPLRDFSLKHNRREFRQALKAVEKQLGRRYPLFINGKNVKTSEILESVDPARPERVVGRVCQADQKQVEKAIKAAAKAFESWREIDYTKRAEYLFKAAEIMRRRELELAAWQVFEVGKQWDQANADVAEAIDFLDYYAHEMLRVGVPRRVGNAPGEISRYFYEPKGVAAIIAPWNFPLAISCGMVAAAIVTGNTVVYKPSGLSSVVGHQLVEIFKEARLPAGVFNYTPGRGSVIGDFLVDHKDISLIGFTGSVETGCRILQHAALVQPGQRNVKKVVCEMGGKNAMIIDDDADLDQAVPSVLYSAFGYQGQKCSACSRVIVLDAVYERFMDRLLKAAADLKIGPADDPSNYMGPVADANARDNIMEYIELASQEGRIVFQSETLSDGYYVPLTIVADIRPEHRIAQEEVFGPLLAVMRVKNIDQALDWAMNSKFALTGGMFSRNPKHLAQAASRQRVGNLYLNRNITGALVERHPFGGAAMSGVGTKAGGPDYLLHFMDPRTVTEDTMRRGFTPLNEDDDWVE